MARQLNHAAVVAIVNALSLTGKGAYIRESDADGERKKFTLASNGNDYDALDAEGQALFFDGQTDQVRKRIYNVTAISDIAFKNPRNKQFLKDAIAMENEGKDAEEVTAAYQKYLNSIQVSFSILYPAAASFMAGKDDQITAYVEVVEGKNGKLITLRKPTAVAVMNAKGISKPFTIDDLLAEPATV
jgi:hypothetical protein